MEAENHLRGEYKYLEWNDTARECTRMENNRDVLNNVAIKLRAGRRYQDT